MKPDWTLKQQQNETWLRVFKKGIIISLKKILLVMRKFDELTGGKIGWFCFDNCTYPFYRKRKKTYGSLM